MQDAITQPRTEPTPTRVPLPAAVVWLQLAEVRRPELPDLELPDLELPPYEPRQILAAPPRIHAEAGTALTWVSRNPFRISFPEDVPLATPVRYQEAGAFHIGRAMVSVRAGRPTPYKYNVSMADGDEVYALDPDVVVPPNTMT